MAEKMIQSTSHFKFTIMFSIVVVLLCCGEFVRIEIMLKEINNRMNQDRMTSKHNDNMDPAANIDDRLELKPKPPTRFKRDTSSQQIKSQQAQIDELAKYIPKIIQALGSLQMEKQIPGPPGPPGGKGPKGDRGPIGRQGPKGLPLAAPSMLISPSHLIVNEFQSAIFHCSASGHPQPVVEWSKVNGLLPRYRAIVGGKGKLEIRNIKHHDRGVYQCKASSILGKAQDKAILEVNFRPRIKGTILYGKIGNSLTLPTCPVTGHPKPKITWSKVIGSLPNSRTVIKDGQLTLLSCKKEDSGTYSCHAENIFGSATAGIVVNVIELPTFIVTPPTTYTTSRGMRVVLNCTAKGDPRPFISWRKENGVLPADRYEVRDGSMIQRDVRMADSGVYVCTAISAGVSDISSKTTLTVRPTDCSEIYNNNEMRNGVYTVQPDDQGSFQVYCDMTTDGGGWTVFQRRIHGSVDFYLNWQQYKRGFGNLNGEFWLGNDYIHRLTARTASSLRVDLEDWVGTKIYAKYGWFSVGDESDNYTLMVGSYSGNAGDSLKRHNNLAFSTKDRDNDKGSGNCADSAHGAWWYDDCYSSNLNGKYLGNKGATYQYKAISWETYRNAYSLKFTEMKLQAKSSTN